MQDAFTDLARTVVLEDAKAEKVCVIDEQVMAYRLLLVPSCVNDRPDCLQSILLHSRMCAALDWLRYCWHTAI